MALADTLGQPLWFVVLDEDAQWRERLDDLFLGSRDLRLAGTTAEPSEVDRLVRDNGADLVLVDHGLVRRSGLVVAGELARRLPSVRVYLTAAAPTRELWEEARRRGLRGLVRKPYDPEALGQRVREDLELDARVAESLADGAPRGAPPEAVQGDGPRTLAVFSFKGGVGKSLVSVNLAVAAGSATSRRRRSVALVDAEEGVGSTAALLGVVGRPTLLDWSEYRGEVHVDPAIASRKLAQTRFGLHCLFAPGEMDQAVDRELMQTVLLTLPRMFALTVVDCAPVVSPGVLAALQAATSILLVVEPTLDCLDKARKGTAALAAAGLGLSKLKVLVNQCRPGAGDFTGPEVREALGVQVLGTLPFDPAVKRAANRRRPIACEAPAGLFMRALCRALEPLLPGVGDVRARRLPAWLAR